MSNYVRGTKRQQIIKRWLQEIDDVEYEVFPTKKEGKYIVKKRSEPLTTKTTEPSTNNDDEEPNEQTNDNTNEEVNETATEESTEEVQSKRAFSPEARRAEPKKQAPKPKPTSIPTIPKHIRERDGVPEARRAEANPADLTISYEILNQLKELGNEIKQQRIKKEQKSMIKQVVQKQMTKRPNRKRVVKQYASDEDDNEDDEDNEYEYDDVEPAPKHKRKESIAIKNDNITEPSPSQPVFRSRIRR